MKSSKKLKNAAKEYHELLLTRAETENPYSEKDEQLAFKALAVFRAGKKFEEIAKTSSNRTELLEKLRPAKASCVTLDTAELLKGFRNIARLATMVSRPLPEDVGKMLIKVILECNSRWTGNPFFRKQTWRKNLVVSNDLDLDRLRTIIYERFYSFYDDRQYPPDVNDAYFRSTEAIIKFLKHQIENAEKSGITATEKHTASIDDER